MVPQPMSAIETPGESMDDDLRLEALHPDYQHSPVFNTNDTSQLAMPMVVEGSPKTARSLSTLNGLALVIGLQIGSGIFAAPAYVSSMVGTTVSAITVWLVAGTMVWAGASTLVEFASSLPTNGGLAEYLYFCYGKPFAFLFCFIWILISRPCANALISLILGEHVQRACWPQSDNVPWITTIIALLAFNSMTMFNMKGSNIGVKAANAFLVLKITIVVGIVVLGILAQTRNQPTGQSEGLPSIAHGVFQRNISKVNSKRVSAYDFGSAIFAALFTFGGWENLGFIAGNIENPAKVLPRIITWSTLIVVPAFIALNIAVMSVIKADQLQNSNAMAVVFGQTLFGTAGGISFAIVVVLSCLGALNSSIFAVARLTQEASRYGFLPHIFQISSDKISDLLKSWRLDDPEMYQRQNSDQNGAAIYAMFLNACIANCFILVGTLRNMIIFKGVTEYSFYTMTAAGCFILRSRLGPQAQPFRTYSTNPILFCIMSLALIIQQAIAKPLQIAAIPVVMAVGVLVYFGIERWKTYALSVRHFEQPQIPENEGLVSQRFQSAHQ